VDVEISDSLGNLLENEHLRLFDYLLNRLEEHGIKILITPIAFWGNGYPEQDIKTNGFSYVYGKGNAVVSEAAIRAQENYLKQLLAHVNPYTKQTYKDDPDVIALEINNEPHHSGPKEKTTEYVNRLAAAVRSTGWTKPVFYNISESPAYADAVIKAAVEGHSFQWYPTGLVANHEQRGNFLPNVDQYVIPFSDTIPAFRNKGRMVYEFDAGDVLQPVMYPAIARSFRTAGFQWATQFAYDPMATAYANTEYQTHYLNLVYTPAKAISLLIASRAFHELPRLKSYGHYPADTVFGNFRINYRHQLSEMNSATEFYYCNTTTSLPKDVHQLRHIAGVGSSPLVQYEGSGAYFLDKVTDSVWRLEVMPDAVSILDPFEKPSPQKTVTGIYWRSNKMQLSLPDLPSFYVQAINAGNESSAVATQGSFTVQPGVYVITRTKETNKGIDAHYYAPPTSKNLVVVHTPMPEVTGSKPFAIDAIMAGGDDGDKLTIELSHTANKWKTIALQHIADMHYGAIVPAHMVVPGILNYRILVQKQNGDTYTFPGGYKGNPYAWDAVQNDSWQTIVSSAETLLELFNPNTDRTKLMVYNTDWRNNSIAYSIADQPGQLVLDARMNKPSVSGQLGWQFYFRGKIAGRIGELADAKTLVFRARGDQNTKASVTLVTRDADAYTITVQLTPDWQTFEIPLSSLQKGPYLLLPRPYPGFQPLAFETDSHTPFQIAEAEKIQWVLEATTPGVPVHAEIGNVCLKK
jgi:hypothetical protein